MKKWKTVKDEYHNINNILNFHRSTMHHKSNMSVNHIIPVIDNLLTKDNEEDSRIVEIDPAELKENEDEFFKILEQRRTSWQFGTPMNREQLSALLTKAFGISQRRKFGEFWVNLKTYASAGALYSVEPYIYINDVEDNSNEIVLEIVGNHSRKIFIYNLTQNEFDLISREKCNEVSFVANMYIICNRGKIGRKYGDFGYILSLLDAGHFIENIKCFSIEEKLSFTLDYNPCTSIDMLRLPKPYQM